MSNVGVNAVADNGGLLRREKNAQSLVFMFDVTLPLPLDPKTLAHAGLLAEHELEEVGKTKRAKYGGAQRAAY